MTVTTYLMVSLETPAARALTGSNKPRVLGFYGELRMDRL
jgi:hypothetical protein